MGLSFCKHGAKKGAVESLISMFGRAENCN